MMVVEPAPSNHTMIGHFALSTLSETCFEDIDCEVCITKQKTRKLQFSNDETEQVEEYEYIFSMKKNQTWMNLRESHSKAKKS